jgi:hypothetical protein
VKELSGSSSAASCPLGLLAMGILKPVLLMRESPIIIDLNMEGNLEKIKYVLRFMFTLL